MTIHVGEMHTDVLPPPGTGSGPSTTVDGPPGQDTEDARWLQSRGRTEWLARRTAAEGFDD